MPAYSKPLGTRGTSVCLAASLGLLTTAPARVCAQDSTAVPPRIGMLVRNVSDVSEEILLKGEAGCGEVFHAAGIGIAWMKCRRECELDWTRRRDPGGDTAASAKVTQHRRLWHRSAIRARRDSVVHLL
jgi:hypothetical protein